MIPTPPIDQAVVTDPGGGSTGGYALVASSASLTIDEREHLAAYPQVSDHLHTQAEPRPHLSFYRLPGERWALTRRFVSGRRRGVFHRLVVHTLVVDPETLALFDDDAWLMAFMARFPGAGDGQPGTWAALSEEAAAMRGDLPPACGIAPSDPRRERLELIARRRALACERLGGERVQEILARAYTAVEQGQRVLAPQDPETERILGFAWSAMPAPDRMATPWTTHLGPGAGSLFRWAQAVSPGEALRQQSQPRQWSLLDEPAQVSRTARLLANVVRGDALVFQNTDEGFAAYRLTLQRADRLEAWLNWNERAHEVEAAAESGDNLRLAAALDAAGLRPRGSPPEWCSATQVLEWGRSAVESQRDNGSSVENAAAHVHAAFKERCLTDSGFAPDKVLAYIERAAHSPSSVEAVLALALREAASRPDSLGALETLVAQLLPLPALQTPGGGALLASAIAELTHRESRGVDKILRAVSRQPGVLCQILERLPAQRSSFAAWLRLHRVADQAGDHALAARIVDAHVTPAVVDDGILWSRLDTDLRPAVLDAVCRAPAQLPRALGSWGDDAYDAALSAWREHLRRDPQMAQAAAQGVTANARAVRERSAIVGLATLLRDAGVFVNQWFSFALAEAAVRDTQQQLQGPFPPWSAQGRAPLTDGEAVSAARALCHQLTERIESGRSLGAGHRLLTQALAAALAQQAALTTRTLARVCDWKLPELLHWGTTLEHVCGALAQRAHTSEASSLRAAFWKCLASARWDRIPSEILGMLQGLQPIDRTAVLSAWSERLKKLGGHPEEAAVREALLKLAGEGTPERDNVELNLLVAEVQQGRRDVLQALMWANARPAARERGWRLRACGQLIVAQPEPKRTALELVLTPAMPPSLAECLLTQWGPRELERIGEHGVRAPRVADLARRGDVLLKVARRIGARWSHNVDAGGTDPVEFLRGLIVHQRIDAAVVLVSSAERGRKSLVQYLVRHSERALLCALHDAANDGAHCLSMGMARGRVLQAWASLSRKQSGRRGRAALRRGGKGHVDPQ